MCKFYKIKKVFKIGSACGGFGAVGVLQWIKGRGMTMVATAIYAKKMRQRWEMWSAIRRSGINSRLYCFADEKKLLQHIDRKNPMAVFLELDGGKSYFLIKKLRGRYPRLNIIAYSHETKYALELLNMQISGYLTEKPTAERMRMEFEHLYFPAECSE